MKTDETEELITGINITPLVDTFLVLLIIFLTTATFMIYPSIPLKLPKAQTGETSPVTSVSIMIDAEGNIFLNGKPSTEKEIEEYVKREVARGVEIQALIGADKEVKHGNVVAIIDLLRRLGVKKYAINIEPEG